MNTSTSTIRRAPVILTVLLPIVMLAMPTIPAWAADADPALISMASVRSFPKHPVPHRSFTPAYTSQTCSKCGHCAKENRESQADFECRQCHARMNADLNAANNILKRGLDHLLGLDEAGHAETEPDAQPAYRGKDASAMTCETSTR